MPKLDDSEVTMEARLTNDPEIEVRTKLQGVPKKSVNYCYYYK